MFYKKLYQLRNADIFLLVFYVIYLQLLVIKVNLPIVRAESVLISCGIFLLVFLLGGIYLKWIKAFTVNQVQGISETLNSEFLNLFIQIVSLVSGIFVIISICYSLIIHQDIIFSQGGFGLRAISTSLHKLVPLETRWIFLLGPWTFLLHSDNRRITFLRWINIFIWIVLIFLTQTKFNFLIINLFFIAYYSVDLVNNFSLRRLLGIVSLLALITFIFYVALNFLILKTSTGRESVLNNQRIQNLNINNDWKSTPSTKLCNAFTETAKNEAMYGEHGVNVERSMSISFSDFISNINGRVFGVAQRASGAYFCLRDYGKWRPNFRGHQLARLIGLYKPVNRWAMLTMDPVHGPSAVTSVVANFISDGYFNGGYFGVLLASIISFVGWVFLKILSEVKNTQSLYFLYLRYQFCLLLITQSFISAFVIIIFLLLIYYFSKIAKRFFGNYVTN
jgi:hypothetical protein